MVEQLDFFIDDEDGAVTIDWVVLTAAIVGIGLSLIVNVSEGTNSLGTKTANRVSEVTVGGSN